MTVGFHKACIRVLELWVPAEYRPQLAVQYLDAVPGPSSKLSPAGGPPCKRAGRPLNENR